MSSKRNKKKGSSSTKPSKIQEESTGGVSSALRENEQQQEALNMLNTLPESSNTAEIEPEKDPILGGLEFWTSPGVRWQIMELIQTEKWEEKYLAEWANLQKVLVSLSLREELAWSHEDQVEETCLFRMLTFVSSAESKELSSLSPLSLDVSQEWLGVAEQWFRSLAVLVLPSSSDPDPDPGSDLVRRLYEAYPTSSSFSDTKALSDFYQRLPDSIQPRPDKTKWDSYPQPWTGHVASFFHLMIAAGDPKTIDRFMILFCASVQLELISCTQMIHQFWRQLLLFSLRSSSYAIAQRLIFCSLFSLHNAFLSKADTVTDVTASDPAPVSCILYWMLSFGAKEFAQEALDALGVDKNCSFTAPLLHCLKTHLHSVFTFHDSHPLFWDSFTRGFLFPIRFGAGDDTHQSSKLDMVTGGVYPAITFRFRHFPLAYRFTTPLDEVPPSMFAMLGIQNMLTTTQRSLVNPKTQKFLQRNEFFKNNLTVKLPGVNIIPFKPPLSIWKIILMSPSPPPAPAPSQPLSSLPPPPPPPSQPEPNPVLPPTSVSSSSSSPPPPPPPPIPAVTAVTSVPLEKLEELTTSAADVVVEENKVPIPLTRRYKKKIIELVRDEDDEKMEPEPEPEPEPKPKPISTKLDKMNDSETETMSKLKLLKRSNTSPLPQQAGKPEGSSGNKKIRLDPDDDDDSSYEPSSSPLSSSDEEQQQHHQKMTVQVHIPQRQRGRGRRPKPIMALEIAASVPSIPAVTTSAINEGAQLVPVSTPVPSVFARRKPGRPVGSKNLIHKNNSTIVRPVRSCMRPPSSTAINAITHLPPPPHHHVMVSTNFFPATSGIKSLSIQMNPRFQPTMPLPFPMSMPMPVHIPPPLPLPSSQPEPIQGVFFPKTKRFWCSLSPSPAPEDELDRPLLGITFDYRAFMPPPIPVHMTDHNPLDLSRPGLFYLETSLNPKTQLVQSVLRPLDLSRSMEEIKKPHSIVMVGDVRHVFGFPPSFHPRPLQIEHIIGPSPPLVIPRPRVEEDHDNEFKVVSAPPPPSLFPTIENLDRHQPDDHGLDDPYGDLSTSGVFDDGAGMAWSVGPLPVVSSCELPEPIDDCQRS